MPSFHSSDGFGTSIGLPVFRRRSPLARRGGPGRHAFALNSFDCRARSTRLVRLHHGKRLISGLPVFVCGKDLPPTTLTTLTPLSLIGSGRWCPPRSSNVAVGWIALESHV